MRDFLVESCATEMVLSNQMSFLLSSQGFHLSHDLHKSVKWQPSQLVVLLLPLMTTTEGALALHPVAARVEVQSTVGRSFHIIQVCPNRILVIGGPVSSLGSRTSLVWELLLRRLSRSQGW